MTSEDIKHQLIIIIRELLSLIGSLAAEDIKQKEIKKELLCVHTVVLRLFNHSH